jgi:hypothetical protein
MSTIALRIYYLSIAQCSQCKEIHAHRGEAK